MLYFFILVKLPFSSGVLQFPRPPAVRELVRTFWLSSDGRRLRYTVDMATDRIPEPELHLEACLERVPDAEE